MENAANTKRQQSVIGNKYGALTALNYAGKHRYGGRLRLHVDCRCDCGKLRKRLPINVLQSKLINNCGQTTCRKPHSNAKRYPWRGEEKTLSQLSRISGIGKMTLYYRTKRLIGPDGRPDMNRVMEPMRL